MGGNEEDTQQAALEDLAGYLNALGHPRRLELLAQLRFPRAVSEIHLKPWRHEAEGNPDRAISRTAVQRHLALLRAIGVVGSRTGERDGRQVEEYLLNPPRLFRVVEELRNLTQLRPSVALDDGITIGGGAARKGTAPAVPAAAHVVLLSGPLEGRVVVLDGGGPWLLGRAATADIPLSYDPYVSSQHAQIARNDDGRLAIRDLPANRNGTLLNWATLPRGDSQPLRTGDVIGLGHSLLLFRGRRE